MASRTATSRVGLLVLAALGALALGIFLIGDQNRLFVAKTDYFIRVKSVTGLNVGNPVQLNGVNVGTVRSIVLPRDVAEEFLVIWVDVENRYTDRIRADSLARIRTLGLLGDKYVDITSGSPEAPMIPERGQIPTAGATDVDALISSGEDVVGNMVAISHSLKNILERVDRGEGLVGELTTDEDGGRRITASFHATMDSIQGVARAIDEGEGPLARLIHDEQLADRLVGSVERIESVLADVQEGDGLIPNLINDTGTREEFQSTLADLRATAAEVRAFSEETRGGDGLLAKLATDDEYGREIAAQIERIVANLGEVAEKLNRGEGSAARLINDPQIYDAVNDIIVGINESRMLRWLIRSRQEKGIERRFEEAVGDGPRPHPDELPEEPSIEEPASEAPPDPPAEPEPDGAAPPDDETGLS